MALLNAHTDDLYGAVLDPERQARLLKDVDESLLTYVNSGTFGHIFRMQTDRGTWMLKIVRVTIGADEESEPLVGTYHTTTFWPSGYEGEAIPRFENRHGASFEAKQYDKLLNLVDYEEVVFFEERDALNLFDRVLAKFPTSEETTIEVSEERDYIKDLLDEHLYSKQRVIVMKLEEGDNDMENIVRTAPNGEIVVALTKEMCIQILSTLRRLNPFQDFVHSDAKLANIVKKKMQNLEPGVSSLEYIVSEDSTSETFIVSRGDEREFWAFYLIDLGLARVKDLVIAARQIATTRPDPNGLLLWTKDWARRPDLVKSYSADLHMFGLDIMVSLAKRLRNDPGDSRASREGMSKFATMCFEHLLFDPAALRDDLAEVPGGTAFDWTYFQSGTEGQMRTMKIRPKTVLRAYKDLIKMATTIEQQVDAILSTFEEIGLSDKRNPDGEHLTLADFTVPRLGTGELPVAESLRWFDRGVQRKASSSTQFEFWNHPLFVDRVVRKLRDEKTMDVFFDPKQSKRKRTSMDEEEEESIVVVS